MILCLMIYSCDSILYVRSNLLPKSPNSTESPALAGCTNFLKNTHTHRTCYSNFDIQWSVCSKGIMLYGKLTHL